MMRAYTSIQQLVRLPADRRASIRLYAGHFPFMVTDMLGGEFITITLLREPTERILSYLKHAKRYRPEFETKSLEEIYETPSLFSWLVHNYQVKLFAMNPGDPARTHLYPIDIDRDRLERAKANLERVTSIGLTDRLDELVSELCARYGWRGAVPRLEVSEAFRPSSALEDRIASDNQADIEFYDFAVELYRQRRRT